MRGQGYRVPGRAVTWTQHKDILQKDLHIMVGTQNASGQWGTTGGFSARTEATRPELLKIRLASIRETNRARAGACMGGRRQVRGLGRDSKDSAESRTCWDRDGAQVHQTCIPECGEIHGTIQRHRETRPGRNQPQTTDLFSGNHIKKKYKMRTKLEDSTTRFFTNVPKILANSKARSRN